MDEKLIIPAILVKNKADFISRILAIKPYVKRVQIDIMDGEFVPNKTLQPEEFDYAVLEGLEVEFHLMVKDWFYYLKRIAKKGKRFCYQFHMESFNSDSDCLRAISMVRKLDAKVFLALNPATELAKIIPYLSKIDGVLVMTVVPGFSGQGYIKATESKISELRKLAPNLDIEVDGGINLDTIGSAARAGANLFGCANAIFGEKDVQKAIQQLKQKIQA